MKDMSIKETLEYNIKKQKITKEEIKGIINFLYELVPTLYYNKENNLLNDLQEIYIKKRKEE